MTPAPNAAGSHSVAKVLGTLALAAAAGLYGGGYAFLLWIKRPPPPDEPLAALVEPIRYGWWYDEITKDEQGKLLRSVGGGIGLALVGAVWLMWPKPRPLHGDARFATKREIRDAGLLGNQGIILGRYGSKYLMLDGQQGVEIEAPPRSGKGVGFVIPNLLNWPGSCLVNDIKGENYRLTAGYRAARGHAVFRFDPLSADGCSHRWNPLTYVAENSYRQLDDLQRIAWLRYPNPTTGDPFWMSSARSLFLGVALYVFETEGVPRTMGEILRQGMSSTGEGFKKHWERLIDRAEKAGFPLEPTTERLLRDSSDLAPQTVSSIRKQFTSGLELWLNPMIDAATSDNDFDLRELRSRPMSIFICSVSDDLERLEPLRNLFFQQAIGLHTRELPEDNPALKHQLFLVLDELTSLGRIPALLKAAAFLPGYNIRLACIVQAHSQLIDTYGVNGAATLRKMLAARIVFTPNSFEDAEGISKELGTYTVKQKSRSTPSMMGGNKGGSVSTSDQPRRLMLPQEVKEMGPSRMILFYENLRPVFAHRIRYYADALFAKRLLPPPEVPALDIDAAVQRIQRMEPEPEAHAVTAADVPTLATKRLPDFVGDFDSIAIPTDRPMTDAEVRGAADAFLATLTAQEK